MVPLCGDDNVVSAVRVSASYCPLVAYTPVSAAAANVEGNYSGMGADAESLFIGWKEYGWDSLEPDGMSAMPLRVVSASYYPEEIGYQCEIDNFGFSVSIPGFDETNPFPEAVDIEELICEDGGVFSRSSSFGLDVSARNGVSYVGATQGGPDMVSLVSRRYDYHGDGDPCDLSDMLSAVAKEYMPHSKSGMVASSLLWGRTVLGPTDDVSFVNRSQANLACDEVVFGVETLNREIDMAVDGVGITITNGRSTIEFRDGKSIMFASADAGVGGGLYSLMLVSGGQIPSDVMEAFVPYGQWGNGTSAYMATSGMWMAYVVDGDELRPVDFSNAKVSGEEYVDIGGDYYGDTVEGVVTARLASVGSAVDDWHEYENRTDECACVSPVWTHGGDRFPLSVAPHVVSANGDLNVYVKASDSMSYGFAGSGVSVSIPEHDYEAESVFVVPSVPNTAALGKIVVSGCDGWGEKAWETEEFVAAPYFVPDSLSAFVVGDGTFDGMEYRFCLSAYNVDGSGGMMPVHRLHEYKWEIESLTKTKMESWMLLNDSGDVISVGDDAAAAGLNVSAAIVPNETDNLTMAGEWSVRVRAILTSAGEQVTNALGEPVVSDWVLMHGKCRYGAFEWNVACTDPEEIFTGQMLYFDDPGAYATIKYIVSRGETPPVAHESTVAVSSLIGSDPNEIRSGVDYPVVFSDMIYASDGIACPEWGETSIRLRVNMVARYVPELKYIDMVRLFAFPELAFDAKTASFYWNTSVTGGPVDTPTAYGNYEIFDANGHRGAFYLVANTGDVPSDVGFVDTTCTVCMDGIEMYDVGYGQIDRREDPNSSKWFKWVPTTYTQPGSYTMRVGLDFQRGDGLTYAFAEERTRSVEFETCTRAFGGTGPRRLYVETVAYEDNTLECLSGDGVASLDPVGPSLLSFPDFASAWYQSNYVRIGFPVCGVVGDCDPEENTDDPDNRIYVSDTGGGRKLYPLYSEWEADFYACSVESSDGWSYRSYVPGEGRVCGLRPTTYRTVLGVVRGEDPTISVTATKPAIVSMSANVGGMVVTGWSATEVSPPMTAEAVLHGADAVSFVPEAYVVSVTSGTSILWRNMTVSGLYDGYFVDAYGSDRTKQLPPGEDYVMSGFGGEGFCRFAASGYARLVDADGRSKTVVTEYDAPRMLYVGEYDSEIDPPYRSPMSNNIVLDYGEDAVTVGPNEFITSELLNGKMDMLQHDLEQVLKSAKVFANSPYAYIGYLGRGFLRGGDLASYGMWVDLGGGGEHDISSAGSAVKDCPISGANSFYVNPDESIAYFLDYPVPDRYVVCSLGSVPVLASGDYSDVYSEEGFTRPRITSVRVDADGRSYFAVPDLNRVVCYSKYNDDGNGDVRFLFDWGGFGGPNAKLKFNGPTCLAIDEGVDGYGQSLYVLDSGNSCVKKYNLSGVWRGTYRYELAKGERAIGMDVDTKGRMHILTNSRDIILGADGSHVDDYVLDVADPVCVFRNRKNDFVYIMFRKNIVKITGDGDFLCRFTDGIGWKKVVAEGGIPEFAGDMRAGYADIHDQVWVLFDGMLVAYSDVVRQERLYSPEVEKYMWRPEDIHAAPGEYVSDIVVNTVLQRMYDNVNLVRRAMHSKIDYHERNGVTLTEIVGLTPVEYRKLNIAEKDDVVVPLNAPMTSESFNYCIRMIYRAIETLLSFVQDETVV